MTDDNQKTLEKHFDRVHSAQLESQTLPDIWRRACGDDYPEEVNPSAFYARSVLQQLVEGLQLKPGETVVDLGCRNGGAALWVARNSRHQCHRRRPFCRTRRRRNGTRPLLGDK